MARNNFFQGLPAILLAAALAFAGCDNGSSGGGSATITFNAEGGAVAPLSVTVNSGDTVPELPVPTRDGCLFEAWRTMADGGGEVFASSTPVTASMTVYAKWVIDPAPGNGGMGAPLTIPSTQVVDDRTREPISADTNYQLTADWIGAHPKLTASIVSGKLQAILGAPDFNPGHTNFGAGPETSNANGVKMYIVSRLENEALEKSIRFRENVSGASYRWNLVYADKAGLVQGATSGGDVYDVDLKAGWNAARQTNGKYIAAAGFRNAVPCLDDTVRQ